MPFKTKESRREYEKKWREKNKDKIIADRKAYNSLERVKLYKYNYNRSPKMIIARDNYYKKNKEKYRDARKRRKELAYDILGGKCSICGFSDYRALQVDHINADGRHERGLLNRDDYYPNVVKSFLAGEGRYQLLCCNCNWIKREKNGEYRKKIEETGQIIH